MLREIFAGRLPLILQSESGECGLACLAMISSYHGQRVDLLAMRRRFGSSGKGANLSMLMSISSQIDLIPRSVRLELQELSGLQLPAILHWDFNHFVVLKAVRFNRATIHNPALGSQRYTMEELSLHFTGVALELLPASDFKKADIRSSMGLFDLISPSRGLTFSLVQLTILSVLTQALSLSSPLYLQLIVDEVLVKQDHGFLFILGCGFAGLFLISVITQTLRTLVSLYLTNRLSFAIGSELFHHLLRLPLSFFEHRHMGDIVSRFRSFGPVQHYLTNSIITLVIDILMMIGSGALLFLYSPTITFILMTGLGIYLLIRLVALNPIKTATHEIITRDAKLDSGFMETIRSIQSLKRLGALWIRKDDWQNQFADSINSKIRLGNLNTGFATFNSLVTGMTHIVVIYIGAQMVIDSTLTLGMLYALLAYRAHFTAAASSLIDEFINYRMMGLHLERIADICLSQPETDTETHFLIPLEGNLSLRNVTFRYSERDPMIVDSLNLDIHQGETLGIFGPSGCGKSTVLRLMQGLVCPSSGAIFVDSQPIEGLGRATLRHYSSSLMQEDSLLSGSVKSNICLDDPGMDESRIVLAGKLAEIHEDIIRLPMGYESSIGEMGTFLSAGQIQRILLARALYKNPRILFLDEGTTHLDQAIELKVMENIKKAGITLIFVTHRQPLLTLADRILLFKDSEFRLV